MAPTTSPGSAGATGRPGRAGTRRGRADPLRRAGCRAPWRPRRVQRLERAAEAGAGPLRPGRRRASSTPSRSTPPATSGEAGDGVDDRRLAGAVGADQPGDLAGRDREREVVDRGDAAVAHGDVLHLEHLRAGRARLLGGQRRPAHGLASRRPPERTHFSWAIDSLAMPSWFEHEQDDERPADAAGCTSTGPRSSASSAARRARRERGSPPRTGPQR